MGSTWIMYTLYTMLYTMVGCHYFPPSCAWSSSSVVIKPPRSTFSSCAYPLQLVQVVATCALPLVAICKCWLATLPVLDHAALLLVLQNCGTLCHHHFVIQHWHWHFCCRLKTVKRHNHLFGLAYKRAYSWLLRLYKNGALQMLWTTRFLILFFPYFFRFLVVS